jgi:hypothetical protein
MAFPFNFGIPAANNNPSSDQPIMQQNNVSSYGILSVDHVTYGLTNAGTHKTVTFEGTSLNPMLPGDYYQLLPQQFPPLDPPTNVPGQYIEVFIENQPNTGDPIMGYLPFVKCIGAYLCVSGAPGTYPLTPIADSLNANISVVNESISLGGGSVSVTFAVPLLYDTYAIFLDSKTQLFASTISRTTMGFTVTGVGFGVAGTLFQFMVI